MKYSRFHCTKSINIDESSVFAQIYENQNCSICVSIYQSIRGGRVTTGLLRLQRSTRLCDNGCVSPSSIQWQELLRNHIRCVGRWRPGSLSFVIIWASTRETLELMLVNNKGADQPAHPRSLINAFVICYLKSKYLLILLFCGLQHDNVSGSRRSCTCTSNLPNFFTNRRSNSFYIPVLQ